MLSKITRYYRLQVIARILLILATALLLAYLAGWARLYVAAVPVALCVMFLIINLVRYTEQTTRDLTRFLESVRYADLSQGFISGGRGLLFDQLSKAFNDVISDFKTIRSEREEQVRYFQTVIQHIGVALIVYDTDGRIEQMNSAAKRLLNTSGARHLQVLASYSEVLVQELINIRSGGQVLVKIAKEDRLLHLSVRAMQFILRGKTYTLASIHDISHELEEKEMEAWQQLTRVLTHEIMNSVAPISSLAATANQMLQQNGAAPAQHSEDIQEALQVIHRRSEALVSFVHAYRDFTSIPKPDFQLVPVHEIFDRINRLFHTQAQRQAVPIIRNVNPKDLQLAADPDLVEQVLINLVLNALQALNGRIDAWIELRAHVDWRGMPMLEVVDNGPGISPEVQERIFVPFFTTKPEGSGIGLSLARQVMRLHGGTIRVRSTPHTETVFTLRF